jgi:hypothetical protein
MSSTLGYGLPGPDSDEYEEGELPPPPHPTLVKPALHVGGLTQAVTDEAIVEALDECLRVRSVCPVSLLFCILPSREHRVYTCAWPDPRHRADKADPVFRLDSLNREGESDYAPLTGTIDFEHLSSGKIPCLLHPLSFPALTLVSSRTSLRNSAKALLRRARLLPRPIHHSRWHRRSQTPRTSPRRQTASDRFHRRPFLRPL